MVLPLLDMEPAGSGSSLPTTMLRSETPGAQTGVRAVILDLDLIQKLDMESVEYTWITHTQAYKRSNLAMF